MDTRLVIAAFALVALTAGCGPHAVQGPSPSGPTAQAPNPISAPGQAAATTASAASPADRERRWEYAVLTAQKGAVLGAIFGGPLGGPMSMGMGVLGFLYGMAFADAQIAQENAIAQAHYQTEAIKDQQLEAAIEKELERQRALESQVAGVVNNSPPETRIEPARADAEPPAAAAQASQKASQENTRLASLNTAPAAAPLQRPPGFKNVEVKDMNGDGVPDLWTYYNPQRPAEIIRQEEASKADGNVDTWSYFKDGKLVRREVDSQALGRPDRVFYYAGDKIAREERDETGQGRMTYRAVFEEGRLARVERDTADSGKPDVWTYYDTTADGERIIREERDLNGDGAADLWTHFENGRVARRDVNAAGLEVLARQDKIILPAPDVRPVALPVR